MTRDTTRSGQGQDAVQGDDARERRLKRSNRRVAIAACLGVVTMTGAAYAAVPLYELFCRVTGYGGTTQRADVDADRVIDRTITVRFDGNVNSRLPWEFGPEQRTITLKMGETRQLNYVAKNMSGSETVGTSTFNVTPFEAGVYFNKIDCFCFLEQPLKAGEDVEMPVVFFVDPAMDEDPALKDLREITLSYTFFPAKSSETPVAARADEPAEKNRL